MPKTYHLIDLTDVDEAQVELISAFISDIPELIGITEHPSHFTLCFESQEALEKAEHIIANLLPSAQRATRTEETRNWNKIWEDSFEPVIVEDFCAIIAPHHDNNSDVKHCLTINPEMSFGTGHHETTFMMIQFIKELDFSGKSVLDFGCGTGVLAILAQKEGAVKVDALDYDPLCVESSEKNSFLNGSTLNSIKEGEAQDITDSYDIILANVNRNALIQSQSALYKALKSDGLLLLSGLLLEDLTVIDDTFGTERCKMVRKKQRGQWLAILYQKSS